MRHEISAGWRGAPWGKRQAADWSDTPVAAPPARHPVRPAVLAALLGVALGVAIAQGLARQDRARLDLLMNAVER